MWTVTPRYDGQSHSLPRSLQHLIFTIYPSDSPGPEARIEQKPCAKTGCTL